jgi:DNA (cytosine-5)-methyltransferase 1
MVVAGLFSGIGGFELAFHQAGFETSLLCDFDVAAQAVLASRFPAATIAGDIETLEALPENISVLAAGFPCQNLSMAGDKQGLAGSKSSIVRKMFALIERSRVETVVIENVPFMLQLDKGSAMEWLVSELERMGYAWAYRVLDTIAFGLPQRRRRVYLVASTQIDPRSALFADRGLEAKDAPLSLSRPIGFYWTEGRSGIGLTNDATPPIKVASGWGIPSTPAVLFPDGEVLVPDLATCEALQGFPVGWTDAVKPATGRDPRWRLLGNAVSVPVAAWVAAQISSPRAIADFERAPLLPGDKWPDAAWNNGSGRTRVDANSRPIEVERASISTYRTSAWKRLSERALNGFTSRLVEGGLKTPDGFLEALKQAPRKAAS